MMQKKQFKFTEEDAVNSPVKDIQWEGEQVETEPQVLMNDGTGTPIIMRVFDFNLPPLEELPNKEQLLAFHKTKITAFLWRDELVPIEEFKLIFSKDKKHFRIFATCQAKQGSTILERPQLLQQYATNKNT